jgi:hypothetical protein
MLTTKELIAGIKEDYANSFSTDRLVRYLDRVQRMVFLDETWALEYFNNDDPVFPYAILPTVEGQLSYTIEDGVLQDSNGDPLDITYEGKSVAVNRVLNVFTDDFNNIDYNTSIGGNTRLGYGDRGFVPDDLCVKIRGRTFYKASVRTTALSPNRKPTVTFLYNPDNNVGHYYIALGLVPTKIGATASTMMLNVDKWERALIDGVVGECELAVNGKSDRADKFLNYWVPKIRDSYNEGMEDFYDTTISRIRMG